MTNDTSCPENFVAVFLNEKKFTVPKYVYEETCDYLFGIIPINWRINIKTVNIDYNCEAYWCAANKFPVAKNSGLMFGGLFTSTAINPLTGKFFLAATL